MLDAVEMVMLLIETMEFSTGKDDLDNRIEEER